MRGRLLRKYPFHFPIMTYAYISYAQEETDDQTEARRWLGGRW